MKGKSIYLSKEEAFQVGYTIAKVIKHLKKTDETYYLEGTNICYTEEEIDTIKNVYKKLGINLTWKEMQF